MTAANHVDKIRLESQNYLLSTMEPADAALDWGGWTADAQTAQMLNATPRELSLEERRAYVASFDARARHLLGIRRKSDGAFVGLWSIYVDEKLRHFVLNVLVGPPSARDHGAIKETRFLIYGHFFDTLGMACARCSVAAGNTRMMAFLRENRWAHDGSSRKAGADGHGFVEIHQFRLTRETWRARLAELRR